MPLCSLKVIQLFCEHWILSTAGKKQQKNGIQSRWLTQHRCGPSLFLCYPENLLYHLYWPSIYLPQIIFALFLGGLNCSSVYTFSAEFRAQRGHTRVHLRHHSPLRLAGNEHNSQYKYNHSLTQSHSTTDQSTLSLLYLQVCQILILPNRGPWISKNNIMHDS